MQSNFTSDFICIFFFNLFSNLYEGKILQSKVLESLFGILAINFRVVREIKWQFFRRKLGMVENTHNFFMDNCISFCCQV